MILRRPYIYPILVVLALAIGGVLYAFFRPITPNLDFINLYATDQLSVYFPPIVLQPNTSKTYNFHLPQTSTMSLIYTHAAESVVFTLPNGTTWEPYKQRDGVNWKAAVVKTQNPWTIIEAAMTNPPAGDWKLTITTSSVTAARRTKLAPMWDDFKPGIYFTSPMTIAVDPIKDATANYLPVDKEIWWNAKILNGGSPVSGVTWKMDIISKDVSDISGKPGVNEGAIFFYDDGKHHDALANDGIFGAVEPAPNTSKTIYVEGGVTLSDGTVLAASGVVDTSNLLGSTKTP